ncbi:MAG: hypothetical protein KGH75_00685 [Rhodospirillales bacterium]|nr:hypothetical protein [Rhodospirillales bacterium]
MNGDSASAARLNNIESQYTESTNSFEQDLFTAFVLSGLVCTKDGTTANQLDVTAGTAFLLQADNTLRRRAQAASIGGQFTTSALSTTYYLDLNPDGTWSFATSHSGVSNYLAICHLTTDGSGNISTVTDARTLTTSLFTSGAGAINFPGAVNVGPSGGPYGSLSWLAVETSLYLNTPQSGAANWIEFGTWNGTTLKVPFGIGSAASAHITTYIDDSGNYNGPANCGIPTTRNGTATSVPIFTGTTTPTGTIPTGSIWLNQ